MSKTKYHPILFSTPMVQAILQGRKTQTRRVIKDELLQNSTPDDDLEFLLLTIKYKYKVGDVLWVRETFIEKDNLYFKYASVAEIWQREWKWKPSIFMPKEACQIFLKVKSIRVERLQDISEDDAEKEGIRPIANHCFFNYLSKDEWFDHPYAAKLSFQSLWISINKEDSWKFNPFVFVYEFEIIEKPLDFIP